ncbi:hypothetical protein AB0D08_16040 [Kitasatospora sp. NPDC048540]|uniref:hypothetical protein n=1 Tax=Kitasatospora sp. NPDC048540 TaxID=3155634 RepID=UPI00340FBA8F
MAEEQFFHAGAVYRHFEDGRPSGEGVFVVVHIGKAPAGFQCPSEAAEVAFGWRRGPGAGGPDHPMGAYMTTDFAGWREIDDTDLAELLGDSPVPAQAAPLPGRREPTDARRSPIRHW